MTDTAIASTSVLDNPAWHSLTGAHAHLAIGGDLVKRYPADVSPFLGVRSWEEPGVWDAIAELLGSGAELAISHADPEVPAGWAQTWRGEGVQLVQTPRLQTSPDDEVVELGADDADDMLALVERNQPGPFLPRTYVMGRYIGIRRDGKLVAMAGERLHPAGWTEISAVATDADYRRQGLASRLVLDVAFHIQERGDQALMHAAASNTGAITAYEKLGFELRRATPFTGVRVP
ncbi:GNAT family N-acetyltransferase [Pseudoclavibacter sp. RFBB5]|uniref:GNAT family N-acetyltransferase n=1 Tax=Pseudoclavibacter sp. RFBB5 TaxID=2080574 RepID=UPI000CE85693|nr:GNAT family N-acetyltransferase [Pseudoclavibacter sp. RFBB5]PPG32191.1 GNAT family N-acetyltransferase [Pseudoclavibacter sp. RFBB5]